MRLENKIALITASASGIGRAGAVLFAREGAAIAVADIDKGRIADTVAEIKAAGGRAHGIPCDLTKDADSRRIVREAVEAFGGLDIVWNNVGHPGPGRVEGILMDDYDIAMTLNVRSGLITTTEAIPALRARGGGSIVFTSSIAGIYGSPFSPVYSAAKFGVTGLTKSLSLRLAPDNIRVNCVCPAPIDTPMLDIFMGRPDVEANKHENLARMKQAIPLGRVGTPMEVAQAALFLASDDASYITGCRCPSTGLYRALAAAADPTIASRTRCPLRPAPRRSARRRRRARSACRCARRTARSATDTRGHSPRGFPSRGARAGDHSDPGARRRRRRRSR